jgi:hypothetical protein
MSIVLVLCAGASILGCFPDHCLNRACAQLGIGLRLSESMLPFGQNISAAVRAANKNITI